MHYFWLTSHSGYPKWVVCLSSALDVSAIALRTPLLLPPQIADSIRRSTIYLSRKTGISLLKAGLSDQRWKTCPAASRAAPVLGIMRGLQASGLSHWHLWQARNPRAGGGNCIFFFFSPQANTCGCSWLPSPSDSMLLFITQLSWDAPVHVLAVLPACSRHSNPMSQPVR